MTRITETNHRTFNAIFDFLQHIATTSSESILVSIATFLSNIFSGSCALSTFELGRAYKSSMLGVGAEIIPSELIEAHEYQEAIRDLQILLKSGNPRLL